MSRGSGQGAPPVSTRRDTCNAISKESPRHLENIQRHQASKPFAEGAAYVAAGSGHSSQPPLSLWFAILTGPQRSRPALLGIGLDWGCGGGNRTCPALPISTNDARRPVSRVLSALACGTTIPLGRASRRASRDQPGRRGGNAPAALRLRPSLFGLAPGGVYPAPLLPGARCALAAPFRPCPWGPRSPCAGGLFSVALSLGSPPPAVGRHRIPVEPGLSSVSLNRQWPSGRLADQGCAGRRRASSDAATGTGTSQGKASLAASEASARWQQTISYASRFAASAEDPLVWRLIAAREWTDA